MLLFCINNSSFAITETNTANEQEIISFNIHTREISTLSEQEIETKAITSMQEKDIVINGNIVEGYTPDSGTNISPNSIIIGGDYPKACTANPKICEIIVTMPSGDKLRGTGFLVGDNLLLTAGHCVYDTKYGGGATHIQIAPGATWDYTNNNLVYPYGVNTQAWNMHLSTEWLNGQNSREDWAIVQFNGGFLNGKNPGWFGFAYSENYDFFVNDGLSVSVQGYSNDRMPMCQYVSRNRVTVANNFHLGYYTSTDSGMSGSPVFHQNDIAVGIHTNGVNGPVPGYNSCRNINQTLFNLIVSLR